MMSLEATVRGQVCACPWLSDNSPQSFGLFFPHLREAKTSSAGLDKQGCPPLGGTAE